MLRESAGFFAWTIGKAVSAHIGREAPRKTVSNLEDTNGGSPLTLQGALGRNRRRILAVYGKNIALAGGHGPAICVLGDFRDTSGFA